MSDLDIFIAAILGAAIFTIIMLLLYSGSNSKPKASPPPSPPKAPLSHWETTLSPARPLRTSSVSTRTRRDDSRSNDDNFIPGVMAGVVAHSVLSSSSSSDSSSSSSSSSYDSSSSSSSGGGGSFD